MTRYLAFLMIVIPWSMQAGTLSWTPPERFLHALRFVESSHGQFTVGDHGESLGDFQISEAAWLDVSGWRKEHGLKVYNYERHVWDRTISQQYAAGYLGILHGQLKRHLHRSPTAGELYAAYNMGLASFAQCRYRLRNVNRTTAKKCEQIAQMVRR